MVHKIVSTWKQMYWCWGLFCDLQPSETDSTFTGVFSYSGWLYCAQVEVCWSNSRKSSNLDILKILIKVCLSPNTSILDSNVYSILIVIVYIFAVIMQKCILRFCTNNLAVWVQSYTHTQQFQSPNLHTDK